MNRFLIAAFACCAVLAAPATWAADSLADGTDMPALRQAVKTDKRALVASTLALTPAEGKRFWPVYESYQRATDRLNRQRAVALEALLATDKPLSNLAARNLARDFMAADEAQVKAERTMFNAVMRALPQVKAARYIQLESKIASIQTYDIAAAFPLVK